VAWPAARTHESSNVKNKNPVEGLLSLTPLKRILTPLLEKRSTIFRVIENFCDPAGNFARVE